jgi:hypothetical protein
MGFINSLKRFNNSFFDGLKQGAVERALKEASKKPKTKPNPIVQRMRAIDKLAKELEDDIKKYE